MTSPTGHDRQRAEETLAYIRQTMESASTFTAVSGWGMVGVGGVGLLASWLAWGAQEPALLIVWIPAALVAVAISGAATAFKARRLQVPLWSGTFRKMVWGLAPALLAGAFLTQALTTQGAVHLLPGTWLALYGAGVTASGIFSVQAVRWMGVTMLALGGLALFQADAGIYLLAAGFGGMHLAWGFYIAHVHGG